MQDLLLLLKDLNYLEVVSDVLHYLAIDWENDVVDSSFQATKTEETLNSYAEQTD